MEGVGRKGVEGAGGGRWEESPAGPTYQPAWAGVCKQQEPRKLVTGDKAIFQETAAVARALVAEGYPERIMGKTG